MAYSQTCISISYPVLTLRRTSTFQYLYKEAQSAIQVLPMHRVTPNATLYATLYFLLLMILVIACLIIVPAFSVSFFVSPLVTHTFKLG